MEPAPQTLSYEPPGERKRPVSLYVLLAVATVLTVCWLLVSRMMRATPVPVTNSRTVVLTPGSLKADTNAIEVPYGKWLLFKNSGKRVAIRIQTGSSNPITYDWVAIGDDGTPSPKRNIGTTQEISGSGEWAHIVAGPISLVWSEGSQQSGWIYWSSRSPGLAVSTRILDEIEELSAADPSEIWYTRKDVAKLARYTAPLPTATPY